MQIWLSGAFMFSDRLPRETRNEADEVVPAARLGQREIDDRPYHQIDELVHRRLATFACKAFFDAVERFRALMLQVTRAALEHAMDSLSLVSK